MSRKQFSDVVGWGRFFYPTRMFLCNTNRDTCLATETEIEPADRVAILVKIALH